MKYESDSVLFEAISKRVHSFSAVLMLCVPFFGAHHISRMLLVFVIGMINLSTQRRCTMEESAQVELQKRLLLDQIDSLVILARQRGLPVSGFSRDELTKISIVDLRSVHDGLRELVYAPPAR